MRTKELKECKECGSPKYLKEFVKHKGHASGYSDVCKTCFNEKYNVSPKVEVLKKLDMLNEKIDKILKYIFEENA